jgi:hypothetical protein
MNYIAQTTEHIIVKSEPWTLIDIEAGCQLTCVHEIEVYADRGEAISAMKAQYPDYEPTEWEPAQVPKSVRLGHLLVALLEYDESIYDAIMQLQQSDKRVAAAMRDPTVNRNSETLLGVQQAFQIPDAVIDQLFVNAYLMRL